MPKVSVKFLEPYFVQGIRHTHYKVSVEKYEELEIHADGEYPTKLIDERRPAESDEIKNYRKKIFVPNTKPYFTKIFNSLQKIRKSPDWMVVFKNELPSKIAKDESPENYINKKFPKYTSITNWFFSVCFKQYLIDANGVVFTMPLEMKTASNEFYKPYPKIFCSENVLDYEIGKYYILKEEENTVYTENNQTYSDGELIYVIQSDIIQTFEKRISGIYAKDTYVNKLNYIPVRHLHGVVVEEYNKCVLYESRISGIVPKFNEAIREYSDLQAEIVQHIHSTMWAIQPQQCGRCKGVGEIPKENSVPVQCPSCNGKGLMALNPYEHLILSAPRPGDNSIPTPPIGYVTKQTDIAKLQEERIKQHIYDAMSSINMEFLSEIPLAQSGVAKQVDREELYSFVHSIAEDCVRIIDDVCYDICAWRYMDIESDIDMLVPYIPVPERFDLLSGKVLIDELALMVQSKVDPAIINAAQIELAGKKFNDNRVKDLVVLKLKLDPFAGVPEESISLQKTFDAVSQNDLIIHSNINKFVTRALENVKNFNEMTYEEQMEIMNEYAEELIKPKVQKMPVEPDDQDDDQDDDVNTNGN
jgi:hypothetical protein